MSYRGLKWLSFNFVLKPGEFESIFKDLQYYFAVTNQRVDVDYQITDKTSVFRSYDLFYNKVISGDEWSKEDWRLDINTAITDNPELIKYEAFEREENNEIKTFKRVVQMDPVINISPFTLRVDNKDRLTVAIADHTRNTYVGLQFTYPKEYYSFETDNCYLTENMSTFALYRELISRIKKNSKKANAVRNGKSFKPNFWISPNCISEINNNFGLRKNSITLQ